MIHFIRSRLRSFIYAFSGWWYVLRTQQNTWIHAVITIAVIISGFVLQLSRYDWVLIFIAITLVWVAEFLNTALEAVIDLVVEEEHPLAKVGKDVGAAAVLITALTAVIIGLLILGPPLWQRISLLFFTP
jgi:diacylglycerol kinase (ATP)